MVLAIGLIAPKTWASGCDLYATSSTCTFNGGVYDVVVCFDVFEHLPDPLNAARRLVAAMRIGGLLVQRGAFEDSGDHPCHLHDGVERFGGLRWHIHLTGLGLRPDGPLAYRKAEGLTWLTQKCRYAIWRRTSVWINYVRPA